MNLKNKRPLLLLHLMSDIDFLDLEANEDFHKLKNIQRAGKLPDKFPADGRANRNADNYHTMEHLYKNPSDLPEDREYHEGVCKYKPDPKTAPNYIVEVDPKDVDYAKRMLNVALGKFRLKTQADIDKIPPNAKRNIPHLDTVNGLTFEEAEWLNSQPKEIAKAK